MLKYKLNINNINNNYLEISPEEIIYDKENDKIIIKTHYPHGIKNANSMIIERIDGKSIYFGTFVEISIIDNKTISFNGLPSYIITPNSQVFNYVNIHPLKYYIPSLSISVTNYFHNYCNNMDDLKIDASYSDGNNNDDELRSITNKVSGKRYTVKYNETYVYENVLFKDGNWKWDVENDNLVNTIVKINTEIKYFKDNGDYEIFYGDFNFIVPINSYNADNRHVLLMYPDTDEKKEIIKNLAYNGGTIKYTCKDERFYTIDEDDVIHFFDSVKFYVNDNGVNIHLLENENFNLNANKELSYYLKTAETTFEKSIEKIKDYEKKVFIPVIYNEEYGIKDADEIEFNLHFLSRDKISYKDKTGYETYEYDEWVKNDGTVWNDYMLKGDILERIPHKFGEEEGTTTLDDSYGDLVGYLGFDDDDIYYRKKRLSRSFIRVSFYDGKDRATQKLLFYSTIFFNSGEIYGKYIKLENLTDPKKKKKDFCLTEDIINKEFRLSSKFTVHNKYDYSNSSEGFYIYLFPDGLEKTDEEREIYMKVEFNHAKYGKTIPFVMPVDESGNIIPTTSRNFPISYEEYADKIKFVNMNRAFNDMYITCKIKYDFENSRYIYWFPSNSGNKKIVFNLFEPRLNNPQEKK